MVEKTLKIIVINVVLSLTVFVLLEIFFRVYNEIVGKSLDDSFIIENEKYGWIHNIKHKERIVKNKCNEDVLTKPPEHDLIIKFPKFEKAEKTILFIGDSYTHAHEVSTGRAYYGKFEELCAGKYRVFAAAVSGFGTVQEYMMFQDVYEIVKPDYVVWQMCSNDIENNVFELDNASFFNNQMPRPYYDLETGDIFIKDPGFWLFDLSQGFRYVFLKLVAFDYQHKLGLLKFMNSFIELDENLAEAYKIRGLKTVDVFIKKAVEKYPDTKFIGFSVNDLYDEDFNRIFENNGALYWQKFAKYMETHEKYNCVPLDAHWNHYGNVVAGTRLYELFEQLKENE